MEYTKGLCIFKRSHQLKEILHNSWIENNPNAVNEFGNTLLHSATKLGELKLVNVLLQLEVNPDLQNQNGDTALHLSVQNNFVSIMEILVKQNCELEVRHYKDTIERP